MDFSRRDFMKMAGSLVIGSAMINLPTMSSVGKAATVSGGVQMKKLGLIGGIGPESTLIYYRDVVYGVQKKLNKQVFPPLCIESLSVFEVLRICGEKDYSGLANYVGQGIANLAAAGCDFAALTGNTPHIVYDELVARSRIPIVSIVTPTFEEVVKNGWKRIGLLGTGVTMTSDFFPKPFRQRGIEVIVPKKSEIETIANIVGDELELGIVKEESCIKLKQIVERMQKDDKIQAVVLGCTELPLAFDKIRLTIPPLDIMKLHIEKLVDMILE